MFQVTEERIFNAEFPLIVEDYRTIYFDEIPILFVGRNLFGDLVIGSSVDEDFENGFERFFHVIVTETDYADYFAKRVSYRTLLEQSRPVYIVDRYFDSEVTKIYHYSFDEIPDGYKPAQDTLCPDSALVPSGIYSVPLVGGVAKYHHAYPKDVGKAVNHLADLITTGIQSLAKRIDFIARVYSKPSFTSSYGMSFEVVIERFPSLWIKQQECLDYLNHYIRYCIDELPEEAELLADPNANAEKFVVLASKVLDLATRSGDQTPSIKDVEESLLEDVLETPEILNSLAKTVVDHYSYMRVSNQDIPLGKIDQVYADRIEKPFEQLAELKKTSQHEESETRTHRIHVYDFNKNTGGGLAYLQMPNDNMSTVRFSIVGYDAAVLGRKFTGSEHDGKFIEVNGKITFNKKEQPVKLTIEE